ncbi:2-methylaconitate cis-trans isomerase PrpF [Maricurvus nonylphenolicus]|uniref:2-methylaconitate cis-trans isomerase PrpF n=1 Tax=Maricurvus nonylphenolicus TaxID=1008307 RepID=UPI0036F43568
MSRLQQLKTPAIYARGGTSKGVFFLAHDLPAAVREPGKARDQFLLRVMGSPDPYGKQIDGMGGASSSTSKVVILDKSTQPDHDVDYLFGQVAIDKAIIDWSGNCGNLSAAVGGVAIAAGLVNPERIPENGICTVRIWQKNIAKTIIAHVPICNGEVQEVGDFELDGVNFPAAEVKLEFMKPATDDGSMFPTGNLIDTLDIPGDTSFQATLINAGIPTVFLSADALGYSGTELQKDINSDIAALERLETIRAYAAVKMGLIDSVSEAVERQHTPKIAFCAPAQNYVCSSGKAIKSDEIDLCVRALSMGQLHHAMMGTAAVAIATAAAIPGTLVSSVIGGSQKADAVTFGHPSGTLKVGAEVTQRDGNWVATKAIMSRSARILMEGWVRVPAER